MGWAHDSNTLSKSLMSLWKANTSPSPTRLRRIGRQRRETWGGEAPRGEGPGSSHQAPSPGLSTTSFVAPGHQLEDHWTTPLSLFLQLLTKRGGDGEIGKRIPPDRAIVMKQLLTLPGTGKWSKMCFF